MKTIAEMIAAARRYLAALLGPAPQPARVPVPVPIRVRTRR